MAHGDAPTTDLARGARRATLASILDDAAFLEFLTVSARTSSLRPPDGTEESLRDAYAASLHVIEVVCALMELLGSDAARALHEAPGFYAALVRQADREGWAERLNAVRVLLEGLQRRAEHEGEAKSARRAEQARWYEGDDYPDGVDRMIEVLAPEVAPLPAWKRVARGIRGTLLDDFHAALEVIHHGPEGKRLRRAEYGKWPELLAGLQRLKTLRDAELVEERTRRWYEAAVREARTYFSGPAFAAIARDRVTPAAEAGRSASDGDHARLQFGGRILLALVRWASSLTAARPGGEAPRAADHVTKELEGTRAGEPPDVSTAFRVDEALDGILRAPKRAVA